MDDLESEGGNEIDRLLAELVDLPADKVSDQRPPGEPEPPGRPLPADDTEPARTTESGRVEIGGSVRRPATSSAIDVSDRRHRNRKSIIFATLTGAVFVAAVVGVAAWFALGDGDDEQVSGVNGGQVVGPATSLESGGGTADSNQPNLSTPVSGTTDSTSTVIGDGVPPADPIDPLTGELYPVDIADLTRTVIEAHDYPRAVVMGGTGQIVLVGRIPSQDHVDLVVAEARVGGRLEVIEDFEITPDIPWYSNFPIYVDEVVSFEFNSAELAESYYPILDLGVAVLFDNPQAKIVITAHTDHVGSAEANAEMSTLRAEAVRAYLIQSGVPRTQIGIDPQGEEFATADADEATAARDRRVEFSFERLF